MVDPYAHPRSVISNAATRFQPRKTLIGNVPVKSSNSTKNDQNFKYQNRRETQTILEGNTDGNGGKHGEKRRETQRKTEGKTEKGGKTEKNGEMSCRSPLYRVQIRFEVSFSGILLVLGNFLRLRNQIAESSL